MPILEIRSYNLKPGTRDQFHHLLVSVSIPMLKRWNIDVVAYGPSIDATEENVNAYYLMRSFATLEDLERQESAFYGSDEWRQGPRESILSLIETYTSVVINVENVVIDGFRSRLRN